MMNSKLTNQSAAVGGGAFAVLRAWSSSRFGLVAIAGFVIVAGLSLNWSGLVAAGLAPLILSTLPCVAMCALGLCMMPMSKKGDTPALTNDPVTPSRPGALPPSDDGGSPDAQAASGSAFRAE